MKCKSFLDIKPLTRRDKLTFGKYEGHTIKWIIENDPGYIVWMSENMPYPVVSEKMKNECEDASIARHTYYDEFDFGYDNWDH